MRRRAASVTAPMYRRLDPDRRCTADKVMRTLGSGQFTDWPGVRANSIPSRRPASELRMGGLAGPPTFPGWSVGRARLTLNQD